MSSLHTYMPSVTVTLIHSHPFTEIYRFETNRVREKHAEDRRKKEND